MAKLRGGLKTFVRDAYLFGALGKNFNIAYIPNYKAKCLITNTFLTPVDCDYHSLLD
jgi:hypothetical protein